MVIFSIGFFGYFFTLRKSLCRLGYLTVLSTTLSRKRIFILGGCILKILYFHLQHKYWVLYLGVPLELDLVLEIVLIDFLLIHEILLSQVQCAIIVLILHNLDVVCKGSIIWTTIIIRCKELWQEVSRILPTCKNISSNGANIFLKIYDVVSKWLHDIWHPICSFYNQDGNCGWQGTAQDVHFFYAHSHSMAPKCCKSFSQPIFHKFSHWNSQRHVSVFELCRWPK